MSLENVNSNLWGDIDLQTLYKTIALKQFIENYLTNLFLYDKFRDSWKIKSANAEQVKDFINNLKVARERSDRELVFEGDIERIMGKSVTDLEKLVEILNYCRQQILTQMRVPPIIAGIPDNSNRSNAEIQARKAFDTRVKSIQGSTEDEISWELFPKLGWSVADFKFNPIDKRAEKDDIEIIKALKEIGIDDKSLMKYIRYVGIQLPIEAKIEKKEIPQMNKFTDPPSKEEEKDQKDLPPKHETGEESTTREEQMIGRTEGFDKYPFKYEVEEDG